jgi:putative acetyltransferase
MARAAAQAYLRVMLRGVSPVSFPIIRDATPDDLKPLVGLIDRAIRIGNATDYSVKEQMAVLADYTLPALQRRLSRAALFVVSEMMGMDGASQGLSGTLIAARVRRAGAADAVSIDGLFVDPAHQGMGVGQHLIDHLLERAERRGVSRIGVAASITAEGFYLRQGFTRIGLGRGHADVETVLMERVIV